MKALHALLLTVGAGVGVWSAGTVAGLPAPALHAPRPSPHDHPSAQALLQPLADAAALPGEGAGWLYWEGDVPADVQAEVLSLDDLRRAYGLTPSREWDAFQEGLERTFTGLRAYVMPEGCHNCTRSLVIIEGQAPWGRGGFLGHVFWDH